MKPRSLLPLYLALCHVHPRGDLSNNAFSKPTYSVQAPDFFFVPVVLESCFFGWRGSGQVGGQAAKILEVGNLLALDDEILNVKKKSRNRKQELFIHFFASSLVNQK